jgi:GTPase SAR1 family protein
MDPVTGGKAAGALISAATDRERRKWLADQWKRIRRRLHRGKLGIAIFGAGGVGKSTLGSFLDEKFDPLAPPKEYKSSVDTETLYLKTNDAQSLFVAAGQTKRRQVSWSEIFKDLSKSKKLLIINVVAFGYHNSLEEIVNFDDYQKEMRSIETGVFQELTEALQFRGQDIKLLTVVLKQDLWWDRSTEVQDFYENGEYKSFLEKLQNHVGVKNLPHEFIYTSLVDQNLRDSSKKIIVPTTSGYDAEERYKSQQELLNMLEGWTK